MGATCFGGKKNDSTLPPPSKSSKKPVPMSGAEMDRVTDQDKAIFDIKARQRSIRTYTQKMANQEKEILAKIKQLLKDG